MRASPSVTLAVLFAFASSIALAAKPEDPKLDLPPAGILPATITLADLLEKHDRAVGKLLPGVKNTAHEAWTFTDSGVGGTMTLLRSGTDYHSTIVSGPFTTQYGQQNNRRWQQDENGQTTDSQDTEERSFYMSRVLEDASDPKNDAKILGEVGAPVPAYVVEVKVSGAKHPEWIFYDKSTFLIDRVEAVTPGKRRLISTYSDYRATQGITRPWNIGDTDGRTYFDDVYQRASLTIGNPIPGKEFAAPPDKRTLTSISTPLWLPSKNVGNYTVLRVMINGRGLDFELVAGSSEIAIDSEIARQLSLPTYGQLTSTPDGRDRSYLTTVGDMSIGDMHLKDVTLDAIPITYHLDNETKVVGRLGFDFLKNLVLKVDYVNKTVEAFPPEHYDGSKEELTYALPIRIDGGLPFISSTVGSATSDRFIFDNSFPFTILFGGFTQAHPDDVVDLGKHTAEILPVSSDSEIGHSYEIGVTSISRFSFGPTNYGSFPIMSTTIPLNINGENIDGIVGKQFIQFYDVTYDYPHKRIWLKPNKWFFKIFAPNKP